MVLIAIEGGDAAGKRCQSKLLAERVSALLISSPDYSTPTGQAIRGNLQKDWVPGRHGDVDDKLQAFLLQSLMILNRYEAVAQIQSAWQNKIPVVADRWKASADVYGVCAGIDPVWLRDAQRQLPEPNATILLDVPLDEVFRRRPEGRDRHETNRPFLEKVRLEYLRLFHNKKSCYIINGVGTVQEVHLRICEALRGHFGRDFICEKDGWTPLSGWTGV